MALPHDSGPLDSLFLLPISFIFNLVRTLLHFFALPKNSTLSFSSDSALFEKKNGGVGISAIRKFLQCSWKFSLVKVGSSHHSTARQSRVTSHESPSSD